jgi:hypothetical protein
MIDWIEIEKNVMSIEKDCVPQSAREWDVFIRQYENALEYFEGRGHDFSYKDITKVQFEALAGEHIYLGKGFKKSIFECSVDLNNAQKKMFDGVDWEMIDIVMRVWTRPTNVITIGLANRKLKALPKCPMYLPGSFDCSGNDLKSLDGCPIWIRDNFNCSRCGLESLSNGPEYVGGSMWANQNKLKDLKGAPYKIGEDFTVIYNNLESVENGHYLSVGKNFHCENNKLRALKGISEMDCDTIYCTGNQLPSSVPDGFEFRYWERYFDKDGNPIASESFVMRFSEFVFESSSASKLDEIVSGYLTAAVWTEQERLQDEDGEIEDIEDEELREILAGREFEPADAHLYFDEDAQLDAYDDVKKFVEDVGGNLDAAKDWSQVGVDLWLNRNGHGSGFWDKPEVYGWDGEADMLSDIAKGMGGKHVYIGQDNKLRFA